MKETKNRASGRIPAGETAVFCTQAALLLKAGVPLHEGLRDLCETGTAEGKNRLGLVADAVEKTGSLYEGVQAAGIFPAYMAQMIQVGERVGKLEEVLEALNRHYERESKLRGAVRDAVIYPLILVVLMTAVIAVLVSAVFPVFSQVLDGLGMESAGILAVGTVAGRVALIVMAVLLALILVLAAVALTAAGREWLTRVGARLPVLRGLYRSAAAGRFASVMATTLSGGYDLDASLELAESVLADPAVKKKIGRCRKQVAEGGRLSDALVRTGLFSGLYARLLQTGERAGRLEDVLRQTAARYEEETDGRLAALVAVIEPTLVIVLSVVVGAILLSVMLPMIQILSAIG